MDHHKVTMGQVEAAFKKLGGKDGFERLLRMEGTLDLELIERLLKKCGGWRVLRLFAEGQLEMNFAYERFIPKETMPLKLGVGLDTLGPGPILSAQDFYLPQDVLDVFCLPTFTTAPEETVVTLAFVTGTDLGFREGVLLADIYARAHAVGLKLCPAEVGPQLRRQYDDQPVGEVLHIAMEPLVWRHNPVRFCIGHPENRGLSLYLSSGSSVSCWEPSTTWVFVKPKTGLLTQTDTPE